MGSGGSEFAMKVQPEIFVLYGGVGVEREVSLRSGEALIQALQNLHTYRGFVLDRAALPPSLRPDRGVVFPALHGEFGEDGQVQRLLEKGGFEYVGSDSLSSALCMDKVKTKEKVILAGIQTPPHISIQKNGAADAREIIRKLGPHLVVKPVDSGSSNMLYIVRGMEDLSRVLDRLPARIWMVEPYVEGREISIGVLNGIGLGIVEVVPEGGVYDYKHKYTAGLTEYRYPAKLDSMVESRIRADAEKVFSVCGCRDFARVDFRLQDDIPWFLEVNTIPGLTSESILPKSAICRGLEFADLVDELVKPSLNRYMRRKK